MVEVSKGKTSLLKSCQQALDFIINLIHLKLYHVTCRIMHLALVKAKLAFYFKDTVLFGCIIPLFLVMLYYLVYVPMFSQDSTFFFCVNYS